MLTGELPTRQIQDMKTQSIMHKLQVLSSKTAEIISGESIDINRRENKIKRMQKGVSSFLQVWDHIRIKQPLEEKVLNSKKKFEEKRGEYEGNKNSDKAASELDLAQEAYQVALTGFLFAKNKELFVAEKGSLSAYDYEKEKRQIEGVLRAVNRTASQHLHIGTGEGKSTVILPIAALVDAATNEDGKVIIGSANSILVDELKSNTERLAGEVSLLGDINLRTVTSEGKGKNGMADEDGDLSMQITKDVLLQGTISEETKAKQKSRFWREFIPMANDDNLLSNKETSKNPSINLYFAQEKDLVFRWMDDQEAFVKGCPKILMDEAHVAYDKGTPYSKTGISHAIGENDVWGGVSNWLIHHIISQEIKVEDALPVKGGYELTEAARDRLDDIHLHSINPSNEISYSQSFYKGVDIILKTVGTDMEGEQKSEFAQKLLKEMLSTLPKRRRMRARHDTNDYIQSVGGEIAKFIRLKDKSFVESAGQVVIRDAYIDELLAEHKYNPNAQAAVLAITGIFEPIKREVAYKTATYPSFVKAIGDRYVALSGTLMHPNQEMGVMENGAFASFLKRTTGKETCVISMPEMKPLPKPHLFETTDEMLSSLMRDLRMEMGFDQQSGYAGKNDGALRPTLLVDFNGLESAAKTFKRMQEVYGEDEVRLLLSKPTGGDAEAEKTYMNRLDEYRKDLSQGKIKMLISSGSAALGVNFVKPDGTFPDLRTVMVGMPDSEERITQTIGRRRMLEGNGRNHLWYLSLPDLETQISLLDNVAAKHYINYEKSQQQMHSALLKAKNDPDKVYSLIKTLMRKMKISHTQDEQYAIRYDSLINDEVIPYSVNRLERRIAVEILGYDAATTDRIINPLFEVKTDEDRARGEEDKVKWFVLKEYANRLGLPSTLHSDAQSMSFLYAQEQKKQFGIQNAVEQFEEQMRLLRKGIFGTTPASFNIDKYIDEWFEDSIQTVDSYVKATEFAEHIKKLAPYLNNEWFTAAFVPASIENSIYVGYVGSTLIQSLSMDNEEGSVIEIREITFQDGSKVRMMCVDDAEKHHFIFLNPFGVLIVPPQEDISDIQITPIPVSLGIPYGGNPPPPFHSYISLKKSM